MRYIVREGNRKPVDCQPYIDVYPVGFVMDWKLRKIGGIWRNWLSLKYQIKRRNWRAVKNNFNGYLAEPTPFPEGVRRCGSGWTKARALRSLRREMRKAGYE